LFFEGVRISSFLFILFSPSAIFQLNNSTSQQLNIYEKMRLPRRSAPRNDSCVHGVSIFNGAAKQHESNEGVNIHAHGYYYLKGA